MKPIDRVKGWLSDLGFEKDGATRQDEVRIPTVRSPVFGRIGGELRTFGGRARFRLPGTDTRATVGPRTTNIYRVVNGEVIFIAMSDTSEVTLEDLTRIAREAV